jgi:uncharacterized protein (DUF433 family)
MEPVIAQHIESVSGRCGGKPCIRGTRIRVWDIYLANELRGKTPDQIIAIYPSISLADVYAALAYYWDNRDLIDQQMKDSDRNIEELKKVTGAGPLAQKLAGMDVGSKPLALRQRSEANVKRWLYKFTDNGIVAWYSGNTAIHDMGSALAYIRTPSVSDGWYLGVRRDGDRWRFYKGVGISKGDLEATMGNEASAAVEQQWIC